MQFKDKKLPSVWDESCYSRGTTQFPPANLPLRRLIKTHPLTPDRVIPLHAAKQSCASAHCSKTIPPGPFSEAALYRFPAAPALCDRPVSSYLSLQRKNSICAICQNITDLLDRCQATADYRLIPWLGKEEPDRSRRGERDGICISCARLSKNL